MVRVTPGRGNGNFTQWKTQITANRSVELLAVRTADHAGDQTAPDEPEAVPFGSSNTACPGITAVIVRSDLSTPLDDGSTCPEATTVAQNARPNSRELRLTGVGRPSRLEFSGVAVPTTSMSCGLPQGALLESV